MHQIKAGRIVLVVLIMFGVAGCTCFLPSTGFLAWRTNHTLVQSFEQVEHQPEHIVVCTVLKKQKWERKPFSIANTADCAREMKILLSIDQAAPGDADRKKIRLTFRAQHPFGLRDPTINLEDLFPGDKVEIGYDLDAGDVTNIVVKMNRETDDANRKRRAISRGLQWKHESGG